MNEDLFLRLKFFIKDMLTFSDNLTHISPDYPEYFFTSLHFTKEEIEYLLNFPTPS